MQALPSAFFHHVSSASRIRVPRPWIAKSTMVVVPPKAAARVPVSKSSDDVVPPNGMSRCVWQSMPPGITYIPDASITVSPSAADNPARTSRIRSPSMSTSAGKVSVAVTTVPFRISMLRSHSLRPRLPRFPRVHAVHRDAVLHRADEPAQVASDALLLVHARDSPQRRVSIRRLHGVEFRNRRDGHAGRPRRPVHVDALVRAVPTRDIAEVAPDALLLVNLGDDLIIQVEVLPLRDLRQREPAEILDGREPLLVHPVPESL